jgi:hypothetical protein
MSACFSSGAAACAFADCMEDRKMQSAITASNARNKAARVLSSIGIVGWCGEN